MKIKIVFSFNNETPLCIEKKIPQIESKEIEMRRDLEKFGQL